MKILILAGTYPHTGHPFSGAFNEKCALALNVLCDHLDVLAPRPYVPPGLSIFPRWKSYASIKGYEMRSGISIHRPETPLIPKLSSATWVDLAPFLFSLKTARKLHRSKLFDAIISFDIVQAGGIAWRLGKHLRIPAAGWAFGSDVRHPKGSSFGSVARRAIQKLDLVFYQSRELLEKAAGLLSISPEEMPETRHVILPHGIPAPPSIARPEVRNRMRHELSIKNDEILLLYTGRIFREKGIFDLLEAVFLAAKRDRRITCVMVGSNPAYDQTIMLQEKMSEMPALKNHARLLPACPPGKIWEYLCAADVFVFPSHNEGMPNSLLEAMAVGLPAVVFAIPAVSEINKGGDAVLSVPTFDVAQFGESILRLANSPEDRAKLGELGRKRVQDRYMVQRNMARALHHVSRVISERSAANLPKSLVPVNPS